MMNNRWIMVFDLETDSPNPQTCNAVELAAVPVNPRTLEIKAEQAFRATIKPDDIDKEEYFTKARQDTIAWHAKTRGVGPRPSARAEAPAAGRALRRHEPGGEAGSHFLDKRRTKRARRDHPADRARHEYGNGYLRPRAGAQLRSHHRRGFAG